MRVDSSYRPKTDLDEERRLGLTGWLLLAGLAVVIIFAAPVMANLANHIKFMSIFG